MPGPGHDHSAKFESCLRQVKEEAPEGRDPDEWAHRICYTSVGKSLEKGEDLDESCPLCAQIIEERTYHKALATSGEGVSNPIYSDEEEEVIRKNGRLVEGWATVQIADSENDEIDVTGVFESIQGYYAKRHPRLMLEHTSIDLGPILEFSIRQHRSGHPGIWIKALVEDDTSIDDEAWQAIKSGKIRAFSIKGRPVTKERKCTGDICWNFYPEFEIIEVSAVSDPANKLATMESINTLAKSSPCYEVIMSVLRKKSANPYRDLAKAIIASTKATRMPHYHDKDDEEEMAEEIPFEVPPEEEIPEEPVAEPDEGHYATVEDLERVIDAIKVLRPGTQEAAAEAAQMAEEAEEEMEAEVEEEVEEAPVEEEEMEMSKEMTTDDAIANAADKAVAAFEQSFSSRIGKVEDKIVQEQLTKAFRHFAARFSENVSKAARDLSEKASTKAIRSFEKRFAKRVNESEKLISEKAVGKALEAFESKFASRLEHVEGLLSKSKTKRRGKPVKTAPAEVKRTALDFDDILENMQKGKASNEDLFKALGLKYR